MAEIYFRGCKVIWNDPDDGGIDEKPVYFVDRDELARLIRRRRAEDKGLTVRRALAQVFGMV